METFYHRYFKTKVRYIHKYIHINKYINIHICLYITCPYIIIRIYNILQGYDYYTLHFMSDVKPYFHQTIGSALDQKEGNEFSVVFFK